MAFLFGRSMGGYDYPMCVGSFYLASLRLIMLGYIAGDQFVIV